MVLLLLDRYLGMDHRFDVCCMYVVFSAFLILGILVSVDMYLMVVLIFISLMRNDFEHLFMFILDRHISFL